MSDEPTLARDDFVLLADFARRPSGWDSALIDRRREAGRALDEIDTLRTRNAQWDWLLSVHTKYADPFEIDRDLRELDRLHNLWSYNRD